MDDDDTLVTLNPEFLRSLILKLRAVMAQEELVSPDSGSNASDDEGPATLQDSPDNLTRDEIDRRDRGSRARPAGRAGGADVDRPRRHGARGVGGGAGAGGRPAATARPRRYLLAHPHVADHLDEGLDLLLDGSDLMETGEY